MRYFLILIFAGSLSNSLFGQSYFTGLQFDDELYNSSQMTVRYSNSSFENLPKSSTLKHHCPKPGNQIQLNTSAGWATAWGARTILEAKRNNWTNTDTITFNAFSPIFAYQLVRNEDDVKCKYGSKLGPLLREMKSTGTVKYVDFLEFCPTDIPNELMIDAKNNSITDFKKLFELDDDKKYKLNALKKSLAEGFPVVVGMYCPPSFEKAKDYWQPIELVDKDFPGHALCVVGYDDEKYGGAFEVLNSWGRDWGNNGFTWIGYDFFLEFVRYAYEIILLDDKSVANHILNGNVEVLNDEYREIPVTRIESGFYELNGKFREGDNFKISFKQLSQTYLYVLGSGRNNDFVQLFPRSESVSPALVYQSNSISIPDDQHFIQVTGNESEDYLYILFSNETLDIPYILSELKLKQGFAPDIFFETLGSKIVTAGNIKWDNYSMAFQATFHKGEIVPLIIKFNH